jgi:hypothetical protein
MFKKLPLFVAVTLSLFAWGIALLTVLLFTVADLIASEREDTALWLARSCIGEAHWQAVDTGECAAIWWVYRKGAAKKDRPLLRQAKLYSAAIKRGAHNRRKWIFGLDRSGKKPSNWADAKWSKKRDSWIETLALADSFLRGEIEDPLPSAEHYGGRMDRHRLCPKAWARIPAPGFVNWYYARR